MLPPTYRSLSIGHQLFIPIIVTLPYYFLYLCATTSSAIPITITISPNTTQNDHTNFNSPPPNLNFHHAHQRATTAYPYDTVLYHPGYFCRTCHHPKPPRSKHCSLCRACIQRQDHHCIWINNCVGRNNHVYFLLLLVSITVLLAYGSILGFHHLTSILTDRFAPKHLLRGSSSAKATMLTWRARLTWTQLGNAYVYSFSRSPLVGATTLLTLMCTPLAGGFLVYHTYLLWAGATTNETQKWSDFREDVLDGMVWRAKTEDLRSGGFYGNQGKYDILPSEVEPRWVEVRWPPTEIPRWWPSRWRTTKWKANRHQASESNAKSRFEFRPEYWYTSTSSGRPPTLTLRNSSSTKLPAQLEPTSPNSKKTKNHDFNNHSSSVNRTRHDSVTHTVVAQTPQGTVIEDARWELVRKSDLKELRNVYDLGFWGNLGDVVFHRDIGA
jgi:hypothetical protein